MIKKENAEMLAKIMRLDPNEFVTALTSEDEVELTIPELKVFTPDELSARDTTFEENVKTQHYAEGKVNGVEMAVKEAREKLGLEFSGKTVDNLLEAFKSQVLKDADKEPTQKIQDLENDKRGLQEKITGLEQQHQSELSQLKSKLSDQSINGRIETALPEGFPDGLTRQDVRMMLRNNYQFKESDGKIQVLQNGEVLKDDMKNDKTVDAVITEFYESRGWSKPKGPGRGGDDDFGKDSVAIAEFKRIQSPDDLLRYCDKYKLQPQSDTIVNMMGKHMTEEQRRSILRA